MKTTLNKIRANSPCEDGWKKLLKNLGKTKADDEPLELSTILESNKLDDALWCLKTVEGHDTELRLFAVECARSVQHLMKDQRSIDALDVAERYANGLATNEELAAAWAAAEDATSAAAWTAARAAARAVAWDAAWTAARAAARAVAWDATWAAAWAAAEDAASAATWAAASAARDAARDAQLILFLLMCEGAFE